MRVGTKLEMRLEKINGDQARDDIIDTILEIKAK